MDKAVTRIIEHTMEEMLYEIQALKNQSKAKDKEIEQLEDNLLDLDQTLTAMSDSLGPAVAELAGAKAEIERLQAQLVELDADYAEACMPDEKDV